MLAVVSICPCIWQLIITSIKGKLRSILPINNGVIAPSNYMPNRSETIQAAWIVGWFGIAAAILSGIFVLISKENDGVTNPVVVSGQQFIGDGNIVTIEQIDSKKIVSIDLLEESDIHLGDNIYPERYGVSYNPMTMDIYPQPVTGVIFFDKANNVFLSDDTGPTQIGASLAALLDDYFQGIDFSAYEYVYAINSFDENYTELIGSYEGTPSLVNLGPTSLIADMELGGNYYRRYAAVGFTKSFSVVSALRNGGFQDGSSVEASIILNTYHGGLRAGQEENFFVRVNEFESIIPSATEAMRDPAEIEISIPIEHLNLNSSNHLYMYVLPWIEDGPRLSGDPKANGPAHFRDVGIIDIEIVLYEQ